MRNYLSLFFVISFVKCKAEKCDLYSSVATTVNYRTIVINQENFYPLSRNTLRVGYHLCIRHILGTVFELYQSLETTHRYFHIIKAKICIGHHMQRNIIIF